VKIALISPKGPLYRHRGGIFRQSLRYAPLTLTTLAARDVTIDGGFWAARQAVNRDAALPRRLAWAAGLGAATAEMLAGQGAKVALLKAVAVRYVMADPVQHRDGGVHLGIDVAGSPAPEVVPGQAHADRDHRPGARQRLQDAVPLSLEPRCVQGREAHVIGAGGQAQLAQPPGVQPSVREDG